MVSTHSRPKAAGKPRQWSAFQVLFQHTAARRRLVLIAMLINSRLEFQHTAARRRLEYLSAVVAGECVFQHTAARRRLDGNLEVFAEMQQVSTHSRPKAAG